MKLQIVDGIPVYVVILPDNPKSLLPIAIGWDPRLRPYTAALENAIRTDLVTKAGTYGIEIDKAANNWKIHRIVWYRSQ